MKKEQGGIVDRRGNAIGTISVTVYIHGTSNLATIYSDEGITPQANPFNCNSIGRWSFYVANGRYDIKFSGATITTHLLEDVLIEEAGAANAVSIQGHAVNEAALANDRILVYKTAGNQFVYEDRGTPAAHAVSHQVGGGDVITVAGLSGLLTTPQTPAAHKTSHQVGGGDVISAAGLSGVLADGQKVTVRKNSGVDVGTRKRINLIEGSNVALTIADDGVEDEVDVIIDSSVAAHKTSHQAGGGDEISVAQLLGQLGEKQDANKIQGHAVDETAAGNDKILVYKTAGNQFVYESKGIPAVHATSHQNGGGDQINLGGLSGVLAEKQDASKIQGHPVDETAVGNDKVLVYKTVSGTFVYEAKGTPAGHAVSHQVGGGDVITVAGLSGVLVDKQDADKIQGHAVDEAAVGNDKFLVYKTAGTKFVYEDKPPVGETEWTQTVGTFTATPASTSTLTMTSDLTVILLVGTPLKYKIAGTFYFGIVTAITSNLLTIAGAPFSGDVTELWYGDRCRVVELVIPINGLYEDADNAALILSDGGYILNWYKAKACAVMYKFYSKTHDTGATHGKATFLINSTELNTSSGGLEIAADATFYSTVVDIATAAYDINYGERIEISVLKGTNGNASDLTGVLILVMP